MSEDERIAWLRAQIEGDKAAAEAAPGRAWRAFPEADIAGASVYDEQWVLLYPQRYDHDNALSSKPGATGPQYIQRSRDELAAHIARHDPQDVIADCAAKLTLLAEHVPYLCLNPEGMRCNICASREAYPSGVAVHEAFPCKTVIALSRAYRHREGWRQRWGIEAKAARPSASP